MRGEHFPRLVQPQPSASSPNIDATGNELNEQLGDQRDHVQRGKGLGGRGAPRLANLGTKEA